MALDVDTPEPPTLRGPEDLGDYDAVVETEDRTGDQTAREALADALAAGAWADAFDHWREETDLTEEQFRTATDLGLVEALDFYWNRATDDVGYRAPAVPDEPPAPHDERLDRDDRQDLEEALDDLGRTVSEVLETEYVDPSDEELGFYGDR